MKKKAIPVIIVIILILLLGAVYAGNMVIEHFAYSKEKANLYEYYGMTQEDEVPIIMGDELLENRARMIDGNVYMSFADVQELINDRFYYSSEDDEVLYAMADRIIWAAPGSSNAQSENGSEMDYGFEIVKKIGDELYLAIEFVREYSSMDYSLYTDPYRLQIYTKEATESTAGLKKDTAIRLRGGIKSPILEELKAGDRVVILEELDDWARVKSATSIIGYLEKKHLTDYQTENIAEPMPLSDTDYSSISMDRKVILGWHMIAGMAGNDTFDSVVAGATSLNVISPTWFQMSDNEGAIVSFAEDSYVAKAHDRGMKVWAALDNFNNQEFLTSGSTGRVLARRDSRTTLINNIMSELNSHDIDGVNVDLEFVGDSAQQIIEDNGEDYIEFIRELSIACRKDYKVLSVDVPVPFGNSYYHRKELGTVCDYLVIMGYDEHYDGSSEAGSVASISYVENGILDTIEEVAPSKIINGMPTYTRIWFTTSDNQVTSQAGGMDWAEEYAASHGMEKVWDEENCQNYAEYEQNDGTKVQIWFEDKESLGARLGVMKVNDIAGAAIWKLGYENASFWEEMASYAGG
ncbi:glycosyl hydrolase family 18 protein [Butyrivibrio sp. MC2013]|uniref:glycosyl hydrolase family 18 protein n=1 Tax=Butyrivibrio sp. MC2013 TaxID=1280686 RepID=UPI00041F6046|nr:glycosyl hydrolase family 18 protein [Butyrivibrio sp. MC2013]